MTAGGVSATYSYLANSPLLEQIIFKTNSTTKMTMSRQYDKLNRLQSIQSVAGNPATAFSYQYNDGGRRVRSTLSDGSFWSYQYDKLGQVISGKHYWADGTPVAGQQFEYAFDDVGNRQKGQSLKRE